MLLKSEKQIVVDCGKFFSGRGLDFPEVRFIEKG
ncbi:MAG: hypothetical protein CM1200mP3_18780 [Chloroflexota bacterium]|nr:MAG: hypothetical protein CM1200mP3_18780 [Chloroflexota bacterium]